MNWLGRSFEARLALLLGITITLVTLGAGFLVRSASAWVEAEWQESGFNDAAGTHMCQEFANAPVPDTLVGGGSLLVTGPQGEECADWGSGQPQQLLSFDAQGGFQTVSGRIESQDVAAAGQNLLPVEAQELINQAFANFSANRLESSIQRVENYLTLGSVVLGLILGFAGFWLLRWGLGPVRQLAQAANHIAETQDLSVALPALGHRTDSIGRLGSAFARMMDALDQARARQTRLVQDVGHELKTPLSSMRLGIELLARSQADERSLDPQKRQQIMGNVLDQMDELTGLINDLTWMAQPDSQHVREWVPLHDVVDSALARARSRALRRTIEAQIQPWWVPQADGVLLERAVLNVLDNAIKFSPADSTVRLQLKDGTLEVTDSGPGFQDQDLPRVSERFYRSEQARALPGSGLGLSIVADAIQWCAGSVTFENAPAGGAWVRLNLPGVPVLQENAPKIQDPST